MTRDEIIDFLRANQICFLATIDGDQPRVRGMMAYIPADGQIIFHTGAGKDLNKQLSENCAVELCVFDPKTQMQVRVSGAAEFFVDKAMTDEIIAQRPFLKPIIEQFGYDAMPMFRVKDPLATVWTMADNMAPKTYVQL